MIRSALAFTRTNSPKEKITPTGVIFLFLKFDKYFEGALHYRDLCISVIGVGRTVYFSLALWERCRQSRRRGYGTCPLTLLRRELPQRESLDLNFVFAMEVRFAVVAHNGQSRTPVPTNKMFVSPIEVRFAIIVLNGASGTSPPTNIGVRFGDRGVVYGYR